jgi:6-phosphogluconolactonase
VRDYSKYNLKFFETEDALSKAAAEFIVTVANNAIAEKGKFVIALSGGKTPLKLYSMLSDFPYREQIKWEQTFIFWGDERCVPLNDKRNNAHLAEELLFSKINIPTSNIHPIPVSLPPEEAAARYEKELKDFFGNDPPQFDLVLLGLGINGHTASLFPGTDVINEQALGVRQVYVKEEKMFRITLTALLINQARNILFLVSGKNKAVTLKNVLTSPFHPSQYPAQLIQPEKGSLTWYADQAAASLMQTF